MPSTIKVAFLESSPISGGGQSNLLSVLETLDRRRFTAFVVCPEEGPLRQSVQALDWSVTCFDMGRLRRRYFWEFYPREKKLKSWFRENGIHLAVANSFPAGKLGAMAAEEAGIPAILYKQIIIRKGRWSSTAAIYRHYLKRFKLIVAVSEACRRGLMSIGIPERKIALVPNGVDPEKWKPGLDGRSFRGALGIDETVPLVGTISILRAEKGIEDLLRAWTKVVKANPRVRLAIAGGPEPSQEAYSQSLRSMAHHLEIENSVFFCGHLSNLSPVYGAFDLFVSSSHSEAFGLSLATAMACGKAVVSTRSGGPEEIIEDGVSGYLCPVGDPGTLAEAILEMLRDDAKKVRMGQAARKRIEENFTLKKQVRTLEKVFSEVSGQG